MADQTERRPIRPRGSVDVVQLGVEKRRLTDAYHFLIDSSWPALLMTVAGLFVAANAVFALGYLACSGCIRNARPGSFLDAFFFSVQTMATIGYGELVPASTTANALVVVEVFIGLIGLALVTGMTFAKFSRPTARVMFSRVAIVTIREGVPCLMFRMGNQRSNRIVEAQVHAVFSQIVTTLEGEEVRRMYDLQMVRDRSAFFAISWTAIHEISQGSPLYGQNQQSLEDADAEIAISLTGLDETFTQTVFARHSYTPDQIIWGARFVDILAELPDGTPTVDYRLFHDYVAIEWPPAAGRLHDASSPHRG